MKNKKFISIIWGYHKQIFNFEKQQNYHMLPIEVMKENGYDCEILAIDSKVKIENDPNFIAGIKVIYYKKFLGYLKYLWKNRNNIIYSNSLTIKTLLVGLIGKKTFFMPHDRVLPLKSKKLKFFITKFFYSFFSKIRVINIGEFNLLKKYNVKGFICPLSISKEFFNKNILEKDNYGTFIGNITFDKNPKLLLKLAKLLKEKNINFKIKIIGEDRFNENGKNFKELVIENKLENYLELLGYLKPEEIKKVLNKSLIYVNTSISEGQCLAVYEGALAGNYLCLQNILSFPSVFGKNVFYHKNEKQLFENIIYILNNKQNLKDKIIENQNMILKKYSYEKQKECLKKMFLEN